MIQEAIMKARKIISLFLSLFLVVGLAACNNTKQTTDNKTEQTAEKKAESGSDAAWPTGPVTIICPWAVGGLADQVNRAMGEYGQATFNQPLLADNILGAGGAVALTQYLTESANSNKLIFGGEGSFAIAPLTSKLDYKFEDFVPVINVYSSTFVLSANPSTNVKNFEDLKKYAADGNTIKIATNGKTSSEALQCAALFDAIGAKFNIIPYEGANEALQATLSGEASFAVTHASLAKEHVKAGTVNAIIAFDNKKLVDEVYNLECVEDHGLDTWMTNTCAIFMRAGTDEKVVEKAYQDFKSILENKEFLAKAEKMGVRIDIKTGKEVKEYIDSCMEKAEKYAKLVAN